MKHLNVFLFIASFLFCTVCSFQPPSRTELDTAVSQWRIGNRETYGADMNAWDVSLITDMTSLFQSHTTFNEYIGGWDASSVTNMRYMFHNANAFNQDINAWDV
jgi:hypothetical protein